MPLATHVTPATFVLIELTGPTYLKYSDFPYSVTIGPHTFTDHRKVVSVSSTSTEIRETEREVSIVLSGIQNPDLSLIIGPDIKGAQVTVYRRYYAAPMTDLTPITDDLIKFRGFVNNFALNEEYDTQNKTSTFNVALTCASTITVLKNKIAGQRTNKNDRAKLYPSDLSFNRVSTLTNSNINFGTPVQYTKPGAPVIAPSAGSDAI